MVKHNNAQGKQRNNISKRLSRLEGEVKALTRRSPIPAAEAANMAAARPARKGERMDYMSVKPGNANYEGPTRDHLARLQGRTRSDLTSDVNRGSASPLGLGRGRKRK